MGSGALVAKRVTVPFPSYPKWTTPKFFSFLRSKLRSASSRWPPKYEVLAAAKRVYKGDNKRQKFEYQCKKCKKWHLQKDVSVDHIIPVGTLRSYDDLPEFCMNLFCGMDGLQVLCKACHSKKTALENKARKDARTNNTEEIFDDE